MTDDERKEWLRWRMGGIGGSDVAGILREYLISCGVHVPTWASPYAVWASKVGDVSDQSSFATDRGNLLELVVAEAYIRSDDVPNRPHVLLTGKPVAHEVHNHLRATPDFIVMNSGKFGLEVKTISRFTARDWGDGTSDDEIDNMPAHVLLQCLHYMFVTGLREWYVLALMVDPSLDELLRMLEDEADALTHETLVKLVRRIGVRCFPIEYDEELYEGIVLPRLHDFWRNHVETGRPPPVDDSEATRLALSRIKRGPNEDVVDLPPESLEWLRERQYAQGCIRVATANKDCIDNRFRAAIGEAWAGRLPNEQLIKLPTSGFDVWDKKKRNAAITRNARAVKDAAKQGGLPPYEMARRLTYPRSK